MLDLNSKGTIYILGTFSVDSPRIKFILEKTEGISTTDIKAFLAAYKEATVPNSFAAFKKQYNYNKGEKRNLSNLSHSTWLGVLSESKFEAMTKLEESGATIFLPDKKTENLSWVSFSLKNE